MAEKIPQSTTIRVPLQAYLTSDHVTPATLKTIAIQISKNGSAFANPSGGATNAVEISNGSYYVDLTTSDTGTLGPLFVSGTASATDNLIAIYNIVKATNGGWSALPDTAATTNASLLTSGTGTDQVSVSAGKVLLQATQTGVTIPIVTSVTNQLTAAAISTSIWQDTTSGDFTVAGSIGKGLFTSGATPGAAGGLFIAGTNAATSVTTSFTSTFTGNLTGSVASVSGAVGSVAGAVGSVTGAVGSVTAGVTVTTNNDKTGYALTVAPPTAASIATAVWTDVTAGDFTASGSIGKGLFTAGVVPGGANGLLIAGSNATTTVNITGNLSGSVGSITGNIGGNLNGNVVGSVGSVNALNTAAIATSVWQDATAGDFTTAGSIGKALFVNAVPGAANGHMIAGTNAATTITTGLTTTLIGNVNGDLTGNVDGSVASVSGNVAGSVGSVAGAIASVTNPVSILMSQSVATTGNAANTVADCLNAARAQGFGKWVISGTSLTLFAPDGTTPVRVFTLNSATAPTSRV